MYKKFILIVPFLIILPFIAKADDLAKPIYVITDLEINNVSHLIKATIKNIGAEETMVESHWVHVKDMETNDEYLGLTTARLKYNEEYTFQLESHTYINKNSSQVPVKDSNKYVLDAWIDDNHYNETLNINLSATTVNKPDLIVKNIKYQKAWQSWSNVITADVCNEGSGFTIQIAGMTVGAKVGDKKIGGWGGHGGEDFSNFTCKEVWFRIVAEDKIESGRYIISVNTDDSNDIEETNENNNVNSEMLSIEIDTSKFEPITKKLPDLKFIDFVISPNPSKNTPYTGEIEVEISNVGEAATENSKGIRVSASFKKGDGTSIVWSQTDSVKYVSNLQPGGSQKIKFYFNNLTMDNISNKVSVFVDNLSIDDTGEIKESIEYNNYSSMVLETNSKPVDENINFMMYNADILYNNKIEMLLTNLKESRNTVKEQETNIKYLENFTKDFRFSSENSKNAINYFITYGVDENTKNLGAGERAAVISSYKSAFSKLPETEEEIADVIKIANGRWPNKTNARAEKKAKEQFKKIYRRIADMDESKDNAAITVMAYGLRQKAENRSMKSEKQGIIIFKGIYGHSPLSTEEWNVMQAITYSGASRGVDTDGDLLVDDREKKLGTDPKNKDTDKDGYPDGVEVESGFNPLEK
jgi:hypothetical protein